MNKTSIPWADLTWNPITGCTRGCDYCYARKVAKRFGENIYRFGDSRENPRFIGSVGIALEGNVFPYGFTPTIYEHRLDEPLHVKKPSRIFLGSMGDLFDRAFPDEFRDRIFATVAATPQHTYLLLTKRPDEMQRYFSTRMDEYLDVRNASGQRGSLNGPPWHWDGKSTYFGVKKPLPNLWLGVTVTNQTDADERIPLLLDTPAAHRFVSVEPMLGPVDLSSDARGRLWGHKPVPFDWVIVGGKTPGKPLHVQPGCLNCSAYEGNGVNDICERASLCDERGPAGWLRSLRDQCARADVPFFYKHGKDTPALDGVVYDAIPEEAR